MLSDESRQLVTTALERFYQEGNQEGALALLRPPADEGDRVALALISFLMSQMGEPKWREGVPYMRAAVRKGNPWIFGQYLGTMLNDPQFRPQVPEVAREAIEAGYAFDPIAH